MFEELSFVVNRRQVVQIEGTNGAGKTSLIRILCGLSRYGFEGRVTRHEPILYLGHHSAVKALLTPHENLSWHVSGENQCSNDHIEQALQRVGLYGYEDVPSHALSAGQHRRVNLARLYLSTSPLWILDEPFTAIDVIGVKELEALFASHVQNGGAVVLTSHQALNIDHPVQRLDLNQGIVQ